MILRKYILFILLSISVGGFAQTDSLARKTVNGAEFYIYPVESAEGFYSLRRKFGVSQEEVIKYNPSAQNGLKSGQVLLIPVTGHVPASVPTPVRKDTVAFTPVDVQNLPSGAWFEHTIKRGETLYALSRMYKVSIDEIVAFNPDAANGLKADAILRIPQSKPLESESTPSQEISERERIAQALRDTTVSTSKYLFHTIQAGETLYALSVAYQISVENILKQNPGVNPAFLSPGMVIRILPDKPIAEYPDVQVEQPKDEKETLKKYVVKKKETIHSIAQKYKLTVDQILRYNPGIKEVKKGDVVYLPIQKADITKKEKSHNDAPEVSYEDVQAIYQRLYPNDNDGETNVALILPFMLNREVDARSALYTEYYQGFLMAVDSLKRQGASINVYAYDTDASAMNVQAILNQEVMKTMDLIIAPEMDELIKMVADFGLKYNINVLNTFSLKNDAVLTNPRVFQLNIPHSYLTAESIDRFIREFHDHEVIFVRDGENDKKEFVDALQEELVRQNIPYFDFAYEEDLFVELNDTIENRDGKLVVVPLSGSKRTLSRIIAPLVAFKEARKDQEISVFGYPEWLTQINTYLLDFHKLNTHLFSRFYANPLSPEMKMLDRRFLYWYNKDMAAVNPRYAVLGFDTGMYFLQAIRNGGRSFANYSELPASQSIQTDFVFERINSWSGFINKSFYFIRFTPDNEIVKIKE